MSGTCKPNAVFFFFLLFMFIPTITKLPVLGPQFMKQKRLCSECYRLAKYLRGTSKTQYKPHHILAGDPSYMKTGLTFVYRTPWVGNPHALEYYVLYYSVVCMLVPR